MGHWKAQTVMMRACRTEFVMVRAQEKTYEDPCLRPGWRDRFFLAVGRRVMLRSKYTPVTPDNVVPIDQAQTVVVEMATIPVEVLERIRQVHVDAVSLIDELLEVG